MMAAALVMAAATLTPTQEAIAKARAAFEPPPTLTVSEFADREVIVTSGPLAGTHWQTDFAPYQRGILDVFSEPGVESFAVMGSSQWGKTSIAVNLVAYHIAHDPCPVLVVEPTVDPMAKDFATNRLEPVIAASPILRDRVAKKRSRDSTNTILAKTFRGGALSVGGANSASSLAARAVRVLVLDEVDRYPASLPGEGSTIRIALKRTTSYGRRRRVAMFSSPTLAGGTIHTYFLRGDQRRYFVPCPKCEHMHPYEWRNVRWRDADPSTARLHCPKCDHAFGDAERIAVLDRGEWRATAKASRAGHVSFHLWEAYSPLSTLAQMVGDFLEARKAQKGGDRDEMHTWQNTTLGEPVEVDEGEGVEPNALLARAEEYEHQVPAGACCLTMGIDVQDDRLELLVVGWGPGEESWLVDRAVLRGDTSKLDAEPWTKLATALDLSYLHASGQHLQIAAACIDTAGHRTSTVYDWVYPRGARQVFAIIGRAGQRPIVSAPTPRKWGRDQRQVPLYTVGVDAVKALLISRLSLSVAGPGYIHLPKAEWADQELCEQLTSERMVTVKHKGVPIKEWRKVRNRNEALDNWVYALAALRLLRPDLAGAAERLKNPAAEPKPAPTRPGWVKRKPGGWLSKGRG